MKTKLLPLLALTLSLSMAGAAHADDWDHHRGNDHDNYRGEYHGEHHGYAYGHDNDHDWDDHRPSHHEHSYPLRVLNDGHWYRGDHNGRTGWWWVIQNSWFLQPEPPMIAPNVYAPRPVNFAYYCQAPRGYYPNVLQCLTPWQQVYVP